MSAADDPLAGRRRMILLAPLILVVNGFLLLCMVGLGYAALRGSNVLGNPPLGVHGDQRVVTDYIAERVQGHEYRIRQLFPAAPLEGNLTSVADSRWEPIAEKGFAQRVKLELFGLHGPTQLDMVYWVQEGKVTKCMEKEHFRFANESVEKWALRDRR